MEFEHWKTKMEKMSLSFEHFWFDDNEFVGGISGESRAVYKKDFDILEKLLMEAGYNDFLIYEIVNSHNNILVVSFIDGRCTVKRKFSVNKITKNINQVYGLFSKNADEIMDHFIKTAPCYRLTTLFSTVDEKVGF